MILPANFSEKIFYDFDFRALTSSSICVLGGTGFIGTWLVSSINYLNKYHGCHIDMTIYTRNRKLALEKFPLQEFPSLKIHEFDFLTGITDLGEFDFIVNGSTPTSTKPSENSKHIFYYPTVNAVSSIIHSAQNHKNLTRAVNLSSGAVYGAQSLSVSHQPEVDTITLSETLDDYTSAKIMSERLLTESESTATLESISPRLFAFFGPGLPLNQHFAIGNFIRDGLDGLPIRILGNPETKRSYMFPTDLVKWLLMALLDPKEGNYNIGSEVTISILELATLVSSLTSNRGVEILNRLAPASNYVPSTANFRESYEVNEVVALSEGLEWWIDWLTTQK
jgi:dTDP-glucose 4,6-dehydratase